MEFENLLTLIKTVSDSRLTQLCYEEGGVKIKLTKRCGKVRVVEESSADILEMDDAGTETASGGSYRKAAQTEGKTEGNIVKSPLVGTFYAAPAEGEEPFVEAGSEVKKGQTLAIVEAMKLMNEIESDYDGTILEIYVENGQAVEYGQPLFRIV